MIEPLVIELITDNRATSDRWKIIIGGVDYSKNIRNITIDAGIGKANIVTLEFINVAIDRKEVIDG